MTAQKLSERMKPFRYSRMASVNLDWMITEVEALEAENEKLQDAVAEDRKGYVCGELHRQCAFEDRALKAEARVAEAQKLIEKWRKVNLSNGFDDLIGHNIETTYEICANSLEASLGCGVEGERK